MRPSFETVHGGVAVIDPIERHSYVLSTPESVAPESIERERFRFPVDAAASIRTSAITLPSVVLTYVHDENGMVLTQAEHFAAEELPPGEYTVELCAPVKLYLRVESSVALRADAERMTIDFGDVTDVAVGARSHHARPATTVTTTTDPEDMMQAVSVFASALKTTSVERSYPTLRGHPPTLAVGDELDLAGLSAPDTGVTIEVPPDYRHIFVVSSLAYYLGARIVPGDEPLLCTSDGFEYSLKGRGEFERTVENTLKQVFFLDCLVRTEGFYPVDLHERRALESELDLDFAALYEYSLAERLEVYLSVPFETISAHLPEWKLTTHVEPTPQNAEMLPFVVSDLAIVRCSTPEAATNPALAVSDGGTVLAARSDDEFTRSTGAAV
ncbi:MAG TPA: hypothetical protein VFJ06_04165, partial [Halococcus sp.]|nr:hypothetical protein [Halococcus sp.]